MQGSVCLCNPLPCPLGLLVVQGLTFLQTSVAAGYWNVGFYRWHLFGAWRDACSGVQSGGDRSKSLLHSGSGHSDPLWRRAHQTRGEQNPAMQFYWIPSVQNLFRWQSLRAAVFAVPVLAFCVLNVMIKTSGFRRWAAADSSQRNVLPVSFLRCWDSTNA